MNDAYRAPRAELNSSTETTYEYLGFWPRVAASIIDNIWMTILFFMLFLGLMLARVVDEAFLNDSPAGLLLQVVLPFVIIVGFWIRYSATPGKMIFKARILDAETFEPVSSGRLVLRYVGYFISVLPLLLGFIWVGIDARKQGFHDKIARTVVVRER